MEKLVVTKPKDSSDIPEKEMLKQIKDENPAVWNNVSEFMALLSEWGFSGYKLTGSVEEPIVTSYKFSGA